MRLNYGSCMCGSAMGLEHEAYLWVMYVGLSSGSCLWGSAMGLERGT